MRYVCQICGYVYDDTVEKVPFSELPDDWKCPMCGASKSDFKPEITPEPVTEKTKVEETVIEEDLEKLSVGQLAAICSNLSRGCEKQYKNDEAKQFMKLADYFSSITPSVSDATVENISSLLQTDIKNYPLVRAEADADADRGAARVCVWGEKVTRMLASLVDRYLKEGEQMLADTDIWVCTICGFVYIGKNPPEMCPVCKVHSWKFKKIEGRAK